MAAISAAVSPSPAEAPTPHGGELPGPARVVHVDVEELSPVDCTHPAGGLYSALWVLAFRGRQPIGMVEIEVTAPMMGTQELEARLRQELGAMWHVPPAAEADSLELAR